MDEPDGVASTQRYLRAKRTVDDRALSREVFDTFAAALDGPTRLIDVAAGVGTMLERLLRWEALPAEADYTMVDIDPANVAAAAEYLPSVARSLGYTVSSRETSAALFPDATAAFTLTLRKDGRTVRVQAGTADVFEFVSRVSGGPGHGPPSGSGPPGGPSPQSVGPTGSCGPRSPGTRPRRRTSSDTCWGSSRGRWSTTRRSRPTGSEGG